MAVITTMICARLERRRDFFSGACKCAALTLIYTVILAFYQPSILVIHIPIVLVSFLYVYWCYQHSSGAVYSQCRLYYPTDIKSS